MKNQFSALRLRRILIAGAAFVFGLALRAQPAPPVTALAAAPAVAVAKPVYTDPYQPVEARVDDLLARMTPEQKDALIHGSTRFSTAAIPEFGIAERWLSDGPFGVRKDRVNPKALDDLSDASTAFPCGMALASTWNPALVYFAGQTIGEEALARNKAVILAPGVNILRTPLNGRTFEYLGEDPYLTSRLAVAYIQGIQSRDVAATVKHFALNNQETQRNNINVLVDERALREIYLPAFEAAVKEGKVSAVMTAYNKFRGFWCSENDYLINHILKGEWGFPGLVMSDWGGVHSTDGAARAGLDLEMDTQKPDATGALVSAAPADYYFGRAFLDGVLNHTYPESLLDDKARRNLRVMFATHLFDPELRRTGSILTPDHLDISRELAEQGMVLLKNSQNLLPLDANQLKKIAIIGENAVHLQVPGGLSSGLKTRDEVSPLTGVARYLSRISFRGGFTYSLGYNAPPAGDGPASLGSGAAAAAWGATGNQTSAQLTADAVAAAQAADVVIYVGGLNKMLDTESRDRADLRLPYGQDELLQKIIAANPRTVVVLVGGSPVEMPWLNQASTVLYDWYGGTEAGDALARVLFGEVNPSGKLPATFPQHLADVPAQALNAYVTESNGTEEYKEGLFVGYRWYDAKKEAAAPLFPFGFGLSYTTFAYSDIKLVPGTESDALVNVQFAVQNTGPRAGAEIAELYVQDLQHGPDDPAVPRPAKELKGFKKITLAPGEKLTVTLPLNQRSFAYFHPDPDPAQQGWVAGAGDYQIAVGASSRDLPLHATFRLDHTLLAKP